MDGLFRLHAQRAARHRDGLSGEDRDVVAVRPAGEAGVRQRHIGAVGAERAAVKAELVGLQQREGTVLDGDFALFRAQEGRVVDQRLQLEAAGAVDGQIAAGDDGRAGVAGRVGAADELVAAQQRQGILAREGQQRLVARDAHVLQRQLRAAADGEGEVVKPVRAGIQPDQRHVQPACDGDLAAGEPGDEVGAGLRDPAAGDEVLAVDGGDGHVAAGRGEGRPGGGIARELRELRRFHAPVALPAGHRGHGLAVGEEGDGEAFGQVRVLRRFPGRIVGAGLCGGLFGDLAAPAELRQTAARRRAAAPDEVLRIADDRAGRRARLGVGRRDGGFVFAGKDGRFVPGRGVACEAAGIAVRTAHRAVVGALRHDAREPPGDAAGAVRTGAGAGHGAEVGAAGQGIRGRVAQAHDAAHAGLAADRAVAEAALHRRAVTDVGGHAARVRPGGGHVHVDVDVFDLAALGVGHEPRRVGCAGLARGAAADGQILDPRVHAAAEERRIAAGIVGLHGEDRMSLPVEGPGERLLQAGANGRPGAAAARAVDGGERNVISEPDGHTCKTHALLAHELGQPRELLGSGQRVGCFLAGVPAGIGEGEPALAARGPHSLDDDRAVAGDGIGPVGVLLRARDRELIALPVFQRAVSGDGVGVGMRLERDDVALEHGIAGVQRLALDIFHAVRREPVAGPGGSEIERVVFRHSDCGRLHLLEDGGQRRIAGQRVISAEDRRAVRREVGQAVARVGLRRERDGRAEGGLAGPADSEGAVRGGSLRDLADFGPGLGLKPQNRVAAVFPGGVLGEDRAVGVQRRDHGIGLQGLLICRGDADGDLAAGALVVAVGGRVVAAAGQVPAAGHGIAARVVAADAAAVLCAVRIDAARVIAVVDVHALVRAEDAARGAGIGGGDGAGIVAAADGARARGGAADAADALGVGVAHVGAVAAVFDHDAVRCLTDAAHDAADHAAAVDGAGAQHEVAHGGLPAVFKFRLGLLPVPTVHVVGIAAEEAHDADGHAVREALGRAAVTIEIVDGMALAVEHAVEAGVEREAVAGGLLRLHGEFAADGRPVWAGPAAVGGFPAAHVEIGGQIDGLVGEVDAAGVDGIEHIAAARADQHDVVDLFAHEIRPVAHDRLRRGIRHAVDERGQTRELRGRVDGVFRLRRVIPGNVDRAVPRGRGRPRLKRQQAQQHRRAQQHRQQLFHSASPVF